MVSPDPKYGHRTDPEPEPITPGRYLGTHGVSTLWPVEVLAVVTHPSCARPLVVYRGTPGARCDALPEDEFRERFVRWAAAPQGERNG